MGQKGQNRAMKKVVVLAFNNCLTSSIIGILDVLAVSNMFNTTTKPLFDTKIAAIDMAPVSSFNALPIHPTITIGQNPVADIIIVPPVMSDFEKVLSENQALIPWIKSQHQKGTLICSICTGVFFLAEAGLLDKKDATTNPLIKNLFCARYPSVKLNVEEILIDLGGIITSGTTYAFVDLIIYLLEKYFGADIARQTSKLFLHDKNRRSQSTYLTSPFNKNHQDQEVLAIQIWLDEHYDTNFSIASLADKSNMSLRNFLRRFQEATGETPSSYIQLLRIESAKKALENSNKNISEIVYDIGYSDQKSFGRLFKRHTNLTPSEYRKRFSARQLQF